VADPKPMSNRTPRFGVKQHAYNNESVRGPSGIVVRGPTGYEVQQCYKCGAWRAYGARSLYSRDRGATWMPGPDSCPGRTSTDAMKGD